MEQPGLPTPHHVSHMCDWLRCSKQAFEVLANRWCFYWLLNRSGNLNLWSVLNVIYFRVLLGISIGINPVWSATVEYKDVKVGNICRVLLGDGWHLPAMQATKQLFEFLKDKCNRYCAVYNCRNKSHLYTYLQNQSVCCTEGQIFARLGEWHKHYNSSWRTLSITVEYSLYPLYEQNGCLLAVESALQAFLNLEPEGGTHPRGNFSTSPNVTLYISTLHCSSDFAYGSSEWNAN